MTHHTKWFRMTDEQRKKQYERSHYTVSKDFPDEKYAKRPKCAVCGKRIRHHAWRTLCKDCDPVRTVD